MQLDSRCKQPIFLIIQFGFFSWPCWHQHILDTYMGARRYGTAFVPNLPTDSYSCSPFNKGASHTLNIYIFIGRYAAFSKLPSRGHLMPNSTQRSKSGFVMQFNQVLKSAPKFAAAFL